MFRNQMKLWTRGVSSGDETLCQKNASYYFSNKKIILEGEIKDAKTSSFIPDFQTLVNHKFLCIFIMNY